MKLQINFSELDAQRKKVGASLSDWKIESVGLSPREKLLKGLSKGIEIKIQDVDVGPGKLLNYRGEQALLYIKDTWNSRWTLENEPEKSKRFHIAECRTLEHMRRAGRFERYVVTNQMDGIFPVHWRDPDTNERGETEARLCVCKNCLSALNWRGYSNSSDRLELPNGYGQEKTEIWQSFSITEFLRDYSTFFRELPSRRAAFADPDIYVERWPTISKQKRAEAGWQCSQCRVVLKDSPNLLHVHHKNGVVTDNSNANLEVLCADCHGQQPAHQHMKISSSDRSKIIKLRVEQGLSIA